MSEFKFELGQTVALKHSGESGEVIARAEYKDSANCYLIVYKAGDGRQIESWWAEPYVVAA